jgi:hypothetical protein
MKKISIVVYALIGAGAILYGAGALFFPTFLESESAQSGELKHILREQGASVVFLGLMSCWCIVRYEQRRLVHYFMTLFGLLLAGIHWNDYAQGTRPLMSGVVNSVPFLALFVMSIPLLRSDRRNEG